MITNCSAFNAFLAFMVKWFAILGIHLIGFSIKVVALMAILYAIMMICDGILNPIYIVIALVFILISPILIYIVGTTFDNFTNLLDDLLRYWFPND